MTPLAMIYPFISYLTTQPSLVATKNDELSAYHKARVDVFTGFFSEGMIVGNSDNLGIFSAPSGVLGILQFMKSLKPMTFMRLGV